MRTNAGRDYQSKAMGGDVAANDGYAGTSTGTAATTLTDSGASWSTDQWRGHIVTAGAAYGVIVSNTDTVLTIDKWYDPADPGAAAASTPGATTAYVIGFGQFPAAWMGLTEDATGEEATDEQLPGELTGSGLERALCAWSHTTGVASYALSHTFTSADGTDRTIRMIGILNTSRVVAGEYLLFETVLDPVAVLTSGDQLTVTDTVSI